MNEASVTGFAYGFGFSNAPNPSENAASGAGNRDAGSNFAGDHSGSGGYRTRLTTTRVAERAGVSVGTMYQYFPNKQALLYTVTERYLDIVAGSLEQACRSQHGAPVGQMAEALVEAYWQANVDGCKVTRAVYLAAAEVDTAPLDEAFSRRVEIAAAAMFASAADAKFVDLGIVNLTLLTSLFGTVRSLFDRSLPKPWACGVQQQLVFMCRSYLDAAKIPSGTVNLAI